MYSLMEEMQTETDQDQLAIVINALNELPLEQSDLVDMRFFEKLSFKEIGLRVGITEGNAKIKVYRALDKLKKNIQK